MANIQYDPDNEVVKLCAAGMTAEGKGDVQEAKRFFYEAWSVASDDFEKYTSAHFLARHQPDTENKLHWDLLALQHAQKLPDSIGKGALPSLYLNIGKCYEDLGNLLLAAENFQLANTYISFLENDGYGKMITSGIISGLERMAKS